MTEMTYIVVNELFVEAKDADTFEANFGASMRGTLGEVPGLMTARLLAPQSDDRGYLSVLEFSDKGSYDSYLISPAFAAAHQWPAHAPFSRNELGEFTQLMQL